MTSLDKYTLRTVEDTDAEQLIDLINSCFKEYENLGVFIDLEDLDADLKAMRTKIDAENGEFWLLFDSDILIASVGVAPVEDNLCELKRLYMLSDYRGQGIADDLLKLVEDWALNYGAKGVTMWSDTRFTRAHSFYMKKGYLEQDETRDLNDLSNTTEFEFRKLFA